MSPTRTFSDDRTGEMVFYFLNSIEILFILYSPAYLHDHQNVTVQVDLRDKTESIQKEK